MTKKTKIGHLDALIFIDTNIFLDFYRIRKSDISMKYLAKIKEYADLIITTNQVEMEFKKNRQAVILDSIKEIKAVNFNISVPAILSQTVAVGMIKKIKKNITEIQSELNEKVEDMLKNPILNDPVYSALQELFVSSKDTNLNYENEEISNIINLARDRFLLGCPPRKNDDNSIGDAINWEWIVKCGKSNNKDVIIVTRDSDYGRIYNNNYYLNDWLMEEFKKRTNESKKIILTDKLSTAFKLVDIPVTDEMIKEEENVIKASLRDYSSHNFHALRESIQGLQEYMESNDWQDKIAKIQDSLGSINFNVDNKK